MMHKIINLFIFLIVCISFSSAQQSASSSEIKHRINKLGSLGTVLYFAAHPDDENTRLIAWLANDQNYRTAYLSLTRGDGGQNLLGTEQGINLGLIRTQELLAARRIDKGEQYFSSAYDFGFSKTHQETFSFWDQQEIIKEAVYIIRKLQPDVIITRFPPDSRGGHGHHQASAIIAKQAYELASDPTKFPEQLKTVKPWKAKRLVWNAANFGGMNNTTQEQLQVKITDYNPLLGYSYGEIAALSRSQHKSQGFGASANRGTSTEYFEHVAGEKASKSLLDGQNTTWERLDEPTQNISDQIATIQKDFNINNPANSIQGLVKLHHLISALNPGVYKDYKLQQIQDLIILSAGIVTESNVTNPSYVMGEPISVSNEIIVRNPTQKVRLIAIDDKSIEEDVPFNQTQKYPAQKIINNWTEPFWLEQPHNLGKFTVSQEHYGLAENPNKPESVFELEIANLRIKIHQSINHKYVDPVDGEIHQPVQISPAITANLDRSHIFINKVEKKNISLIIKNHSTQTQKARISFKDLNGFDIQSQQEEITLAADQEITKTYLLSNPKGSKQASIQILVNNTPLYGSKNIAYQHIPEITWFEPLTLEAKNLELINPIQKIAYIPGAGDLIPSSLENIGIRVDQLTDDQTSLENLKQYQAVVVGVRAFNVNKNAQRWMENLLAYAQQGGSVLIQYNVNSKLQTNKFGPYPFEISRDRVTQEDAPVHFLDSTDPALNYPNKITQEDFDGWVQERGLYFVHQMDSHYRTPLAMADKGEENHKGSLLITKYGKGKFVYTSLSFFRQLPAGVPGAYRLFVNLLAKEEK